MKNIFLHNIGFKLLSVLLALLLWLTVMNVEDPTVTQTIKDIPVQIVNDDVIRSRGYGYTIESGEKVDIKVKGRRSVVDNLNAEDFSATADFNSFSSMKMVPIEVICSNSRADELTWTAKTDSMAIILESEATASKNIKIDRIGEVKEGYYLYNYSTATSLVSVNGAESQVEKVKEVVAEVDIEGMKDSDEIEVNLFAVDSEGEKIDAKKITLVPETITVQLTIYPIKTIPLTVVTTGNPLQYYYIGDIEYAPNEIQITAEETILKDLEQIEVEVDVADAETDIEKQIELQEYLEEKYAEQNLKLVDQTQTMGIKIPIIAMEEQVLAVNSEAVELLEKDDSKYLYSVKTGSLSQVVVKGKAEDMVNIEISDFELYLNVKDLSAGTHSLKLESRYQGDLLIQPGIVELEIKDIVQEPEDKEGNSDTPDLNPDETADTDAGLENNSMTNDLQ